MKTLNKYNSKMPVVMVEALREQNAKLVAESKTEQELVELLLTGTKDVMIEATGYGYEVKGKYTKADLASICAKRVMSEREEKAKTARISAQPFAEKARIFNEANTTYQAMRFLDKYCDFEEVKKFAVYFGIDGEQFETKDALCLAIEEKYYEWRKAGNTITEEIAGQSNAETEETADEVKPLTIEQMEQETGFTYYRDLGKEFLAGKVNKEEILEKFPRYEYLGFAYGLAVAFDIAIQGKSYSELLSKIKDFVNSSDLAASKTNSLIDLKAEKTLAVQEEPEVEDFRNDEGYRLALSMGQDFLNGNLSKKTLLNELHEPRYDNYYAFAYGLAQKFDFDDGRSYDELLPSLEKFINDYAPDEPEPEAKKILTFLDVKFTPEQVYSMVKYDYSLAQHDYYEASKEYFGMQAQMNLLREEWLSLKDAIRNFTGRRLAGLRLLEQEVRAKYLEIRLKSLRSRKRMQEQSRHLDRELARFKEAEKNFNETSISHAI